MLFYLIYSFSQINLTPSAQNLIILVLFELIEVATLLVFLNYDISFLDKISPGD